MAQAVPSWYTSQVVYAEYVTLLSFVFLIASTLGTGLSFSIAMNVAQGDENKDDLSLICFVLSIFVNSVASWVFYKIYKHGLWVGVVFWIILNTQILVLLFRGLILGKDKILKYAFFNVLESLLKVLVLIAILVVVVVPTTLSLSVSFMLGLILTVFVYSFYLPKRKYCRALDANYIKSSLRCLVVPFLFVGGTLISLVFGSLYLGNLNKQEAAYLNVIFLVTRLPWYILSSIGTNNIPKLASFNVAVSMKMKFYRDGLKQVVFGGLRFPH